LDGKNNCFFWYNVFITSRLPLYRNLAILGAIFRCLFLWFYVTFGRCFVMWLIICLLCPVFSSFFSKSKYHIVSQSIRKYHLFLQLFSANDESITWALNVILSDTLWYLCIDVNPLMYVLYYQYIVYYI